MRVLLRIDDAKLVSRGRALIVYYALIDSTKQAKNGRVKEYDTNVSLKEMKRKEFNRLLDAFHYRLLSSLS